MRTSRCEADRGFTLVELLVVLAILGFLSAGGLQAIYRSNPGLALRSAAAEIESALRTTRSAAQLGNRPLSVVFELSPPGYRADGNWTRLPDGIDLRVVIAGREQLDAQSGAIRFYPDGAATGGTVELSDEAEVRTITVDWLTGRVGSDTRAP